MRHSPSLLAGCFLAGLWSAMPTPTAERLVGDQAASAPNAAVVYWQAFAAMPSLNEEQKQKLDAATKTSTAPLADDLKPIVALFEASLHNMHRARLVPACDWQLEYDAGPLLLLPHLQKARDLGRVALVRARLRFKSRETDKAVDDVVAVLKMARDCGGSPILISMLVDVAMEKTAIEVLAANLPSLNPDQLDQLTTSLKQLPPTSSLADCIRLEARMLGDWIERAMEAEAARLKDPQAGAKVLAALVKPLGIDEPVKPKDGDPEETRRQELLQSLTVADVRESLRRMRADYDEMTKIVSLTPAERTSHWSEFEAQLVEARKFAKRDDALRFFSVSVVPSIAKIHDREEQLQLRRQLIEFAVQVQRDGPDALKSARPIGGGKVEYRKTESGFELRCPYATSDKLEAIIVGAGD